MNPATEALMRYWKERSPEIIAYLAAVAAIVTASMFAAECKDWVDSIAKGRETTGVSWVSTLAYLALFLVPLLTLWFLRANLTHPRTRHLRTDHLVAPCKHLILFLSDLPAKGLTPTGIPDSITLSNGNVDEDVKILEGKKQGAAPVLWRWEMPLRAIRHHVGRLETVTIICSRESARQAHLFGALLTRYQHSALSQVKINALTQERRTVDVIPCPTEALPQSAVSALGWDFEDFDELSWAIRSLFARLERAGADEHDIMIDFTGGQKVTSVVAAAASFNHHVRAQYVQTNEPWSVKSYDLVLTPLDAKEFGV